MFYLLKNNQNIIKCQIKANDIIGFETSIAINVFFVTHSGPKKMISRIFFKNQGVSLIIKGLVYLFFNLRSFSQSNCLCKVEGT